MREGPAPPTQQKRGAPWVPRQLLPFDGLGLRGRVSTQVASQASALCPPKAPRTSSLAHAPGLLLEHSPPPSWSSALLSHPVPPRRPPDFSLSSGVPGSSVSTRWGDHALPGEPHPPETVLLGQGHLISSLHLQAHSRLSRMQGATRARGCGSQTRGPPQVNRQARGNGPPGTTSSPAQASGTVTASW